MKSTLSNLLVATDLGPASDAVVEAAGRIAERAGARLHLCHALDLEAPPYGIAPRGPIGTLEDRTDRARRMLEEQRERVVPSDVQVDLSVVDQVAHRAIADLARSIPADLIAFGPHRQGGVRAHLLGSTADRVIRTAEVPSLVIRAPLRLPLSKIGVPLDFSDTSRRALDLAFAWAPDFGETGAMSPPDAEEIEIVAFHIAWVHETVIDPPRTEREVILPALRAEIEGARERYGKPLPTRVVDGLRWELSPTLGITQFARERVLELIIMGTHGYSGIRRFLVGSVAAGVAREAPCSVLLVPPAFTDSSPGR